MAGIQRPFLQEAKRHFLGSAVRGMFGKQIQEIELEAKQGAHRVR